MHSDEQNMLAETPANLSVTTTVYQVSEFTALQTLHPTLAPHRTEDRARWKLHGYQYHNEQSDVGTCCGHNRKPPFTRKISWQRISRCDCVPV
jgi:hypothetical protein